MFYILYILYNSNVSASEFASALAATAAAIVTAAALVANAAVAATAIDYRFLYIE